MKTKFNVIGVMSGTSLDGLDLAFCVFKKTRNKWEFELKQTQCIGYTKSFQNQLASVETQSALAFVKLDAELGVFIGKKIKDFVKKNKLKVDFIASHGHTIFHQPQAGITAQIGNGAAIAAESGITTVCDFRSLDVALGGQGAPLVPIGDQYLFGEYDFCLNLGGFANVSYQEKKQRIAFDICPVNLVINKLSMALGKPYDKGGEMAKKGILNIDLLAQLNALSYYRKRTPKSLGKEWVLEEVFPILSRFKISEEDKLRSFYEHIAMQISLAIESKISKGKSKVLCTGGGAHNAFLIQRIQALCLSKLVIPQKGIIDFKEALLFAFLGVLRITEQKNCLQSVTGSIADNVGGCVYLR